MRAGPGALRIAFSVAAPNGAEVHRECVRAVLDATGLCADLGHDVVEATPNVDAGALEDAWFELWADGNAWLADSWARRIGREPSPGDFEPLTWALRELGRRRTAADHLRSVETLQAEAPALAAFFEHYDVWLTPTLAQPPVALGELEPPPDDPLRWVELDARFAPFTATANATGQPAMSVPLFWSEDGLPIGTHFVGRFGDEGTLFRLAAQLEQARPWVGRRPPVWPSLG